MKKLLLTFLLCSFSNIVSASPEPAKLKYSYDFLLEKVLEMKRQTYNPDIPVPSLHYASSTPLVVFQDAIERQWGMRPDFITNAYSLHHNMIFLSDDAAYYERTGRCMDDSLVHELVHYVQHMYQNWDFNDESLEWDAVDIQTRFREEFCKNG